MYTHTLVALWWTVCLQLARSQQIIDLTHQLNMGTVFWPGDPQFKFTILYRGETEKYWYESNEFSTAEHGGTHLDSPAHFGKGKWRVHDIPLENVIGPGVIIDITARAKNNPDAQLEIADLLKWEESNGEIPDKAIVIMNSGWSAKWPNASAIFGSQSVNDSSTFHFPGFNPEATKWLVDNRNHINAIGVDTPSVDYGQSTDFQTHVLVSSSNIIGLQNVANLKSLPVSGSTIFAVPLKLYDGSGSPSRIFAMTQFPVVCSASIAQHDFFVFVLPIFWLSLEYFV